MNKHLNIFDFFNNHEYECYEDNLSRGFALCLKYDMVLLDSVLRNLLMEQLFNELFSTDYPEYQINVDIQKKPEDLGIFSNIIAVACSGKEIDFSNIESVESRKTDHPETDLSIEINDTCIIFEFKRTDEDCAAQLKCQAERLQEVCSLESGIKYIDFNWKKIVSLMLNVISFQKQNSSENQFTTDFVKLLALKHPEWFPKRLLANISFPQTENDPSKYQMETRLNQIKVQVGHRIGAEIKSYSGKYYRSIISVNWGWTNEIHIDTNRSDEGNFIEINIYAGDTKGQGWHLFKQKPEAFDWPESIGSYELFVKHYLKFSHFNSTIFWYRPGPEECKITHNLQFFERYAGRYPREQWGEFEKLMNNIAPKWKDNCEFNQKLLETKRSYFDLSFGILFSLLIPYEKAKNLDNQEIGSKFTIELSKLILEMKELING